MVGADDDRSRRLAGDAADDVAMGMLHSNLAHAGLAQSAGDQPHLLAARRRAGRPGADPHLRTQVAKGALGVEPTVPRPSAGSLRSPPPQPASDRAEHGERAPDAVALGARLLRGDR